MQRVAVRVAVEWMMAQVAATWVAEPRVAVEWVAVAHVAATRVPVERVVADDTVERRQAWRKRDGRARVYSFQRAPIPT